MASVKPLDHFCSTMDATSPSEALAGLSVKPTLPLSPSSKASPRISPDVASGPPSSLNLSSTSSRPKLMNHARKSSSSSVISFDPSDNSGIPTRFPTAPTSVEIYDSLEREQEAIVNKLQREISALKGDASIRSRSQSTSSSSSISRRPSTRSVYSSDTEEVHSTGLLIPPSPLVAQRTSRSSFSGPGANDESAVASLKRENESLKRRLAELSLKVSEKDKEIEFLKRERVKSDSKRKSGLNLETQSQKS